MILKHEFVESAPEELAANTIYISIPYKTVLHNCVCGCGIEVVTPLDPTDWRLTFDGETISLYPSIGNWSFPCRSHYWIKNSEVVWAENWSNEDIRAGRMEDRSRKLDQYRSQRHEDQEVDLKPKPEDAPKSDENFLTKIFNWIRR